MKKSLLVLALAASLSVTSCAAAGSSPEAESSSTATASSPASSEATSTESESPVEEAPEAPSETVSDSEDVIEVDGEEVLQIGDWRESAKKIEERGASGFAVYEDSIDGAVVAMEDFFALFTWESGLHMEAMQEDGWDKSLFSKTHAYINEEALGAEKYEELIEEHSVGMAWLSFVEGLDYKMSRDGATMDSEGIVTLRAENLWAFYEGSYQKITESSEDAYKLKLNDDGIWQIVDYSVSGNF